MPPFHFTEPSPSPCRTIAFDTSTAESRWPYWPPLLRLLPRPSDTLGRTSGTWSRSQPARRRDVLVRCDCPSASESEGCIWRIVVARNRTSGAVRRLDVLCRVSLLGPDEPPDTHPDTDPDPDPDPPSAPHAAHVREPLSLELGPARRRAA